MRRYSSYKDSNIQWIKSIPHHWGQNKIKFLFNEKPSTPNPLLNSGSISFGEVIFKDDESIPESTKLSYQEVLDGEFLINPLNLNYDLKSLRISKSKINVVVSQGYIVLRLISNNNPEYFKYLLRDFDIRHLKSLGSGVRQTISFKDLSTEELPLPSLSEQLQIVQFLDTKTSLIDSLIEKTEKKIELLKEQRTSLINHVVTKGLNPNVKMKDSGVEWIGEIPEHWRISKFKYDSLIPVKYGMNISGDNYKEEGIRFIRITDLTEEGELILEDGKYLDEELVPEEFLLNRFDILFCRSGHTVGKSYLHLQDGKFTSGGYLVRLNFRNYEESKFVFYLSKTHFYWDWIRLNTVVSTIENVNGDKYQNFPYPKPPVKEQQQIVDFLDKKNKIIDSTISIEERRIETLKEYRQSLISEVVTGKIKVTTDE